ncbi:hypothetical protein SAMN04487843_11121 [Methylobacterium sp. ap11]|uniref:hypothetical protein n=1 Tax=Methylobacterium sp. ap11 TaxID=1761799 RepID=UPI0008B0B4B2|nr:hypothetical protein [Methylobacterium sp. ap11]SEP31808.1 hypothetical protein SAMN04487843_11121 [Methylobacterium sp. ap11]
MADIHDAERLRIQLGSWIVGGAMSATVACLVVIFACIGVNNYNNSSTTGLITTFFSALVGIFLGVKASGAASAKGNAAVTQEATYAEANRLAIFRSVLGDIGRHYFKPSARCQAILDDARARGSLHTIEFNTTAADGPNQGDGGAVSRRVRPVRFVVGYARTYP